MDKSTLEKIVKAAARMSMGQTQFLLDPHSLETFPEVAGPIAAVLVEQAINNEEVRNALLS